MGPGRRGQRQTETPPPTTGQENPKTAMKQTQYTPAPGPSFTSSDEIEDQTPEISSHGSEYDPDATPSRVQPQGQSSNSKGKRPERQSSEHPYEPNMLYDLIKQQNEKISILEQLLLRNSNPSTPLHATLTSAPPPVDDPIQKQTDRFEKKSLSILSARNKVQLRTNNFSEWYENLLLDAESIKARAIMDERQEEPPNGISDLDFALWHAKYDVLLRHVTSTISASLVKDLQTVDSTNLFDILDHFKAEYGISPAKERLGMVKALRELYIQNNNFNGFLFKFRKLTQRLHKMDITVEDLLHDMFITSLKDYNKQFVDSQLDDYFASNRTLPINNLDLKRFQEALLHRRKRINKSLRPMKLRPRPDPLWRPINPPTIVLLGALPVVRTRRSVEAKVAVPTPTDVRTVDTMATEPTIALIDTQNAKARSFAKNMTA